MRRSDREVTSFDEIMEIVQKCDVCRLGLKDEEVPYIVPLNFGEEVDNGQVFLYFHSAQTGRKHDLIKLDNHVCFEMDCGHSLFLDEKKGNCSMEYSCIMGDGVIEYVEDFAEKKRALDLIMAHYDRSDFRYNEDVISFTCVFRLTVNHITAKRCIKK